MSSNQVHLKQLVYQGAENKRLSINDVILDRISDELAIINKYGFTDYFILCHKIAQACNELGLIRSYSRACAANSLVNYCLDIAYINPMDENLMFERLVYPDIEFHPDIDFDIPKGSQKKLIEELKRKIPEYNLYLIALPKPIDNNEFIYKNNGYKKHETGVIFHNEKLVNSVFEYENTQFYVSHNPAFDPVYNQKVDLIEQDYLHKLQLIVKEIGNKYHPYKLPLDDAQVFDFFISGDLDNIFQFGANRLKKVLKDFKPESIHDLSIIHAMYRPGLANWIPTIIKNKLSGVSYDWHDGRVYEILGESYHVIVYQETFLRLAKELAGINFDEAELWRRKMMKDKTNHLINEFVLYFIDRCFRYSSLDKFEIALLAELIRDTFRFTFPKAHSLSYSIIGYWGAYYKTHFTSLYEKIFK